jgi:molybdopterin converting factor small subunit
MQVSREDVPQQKRRYIFIDFDQTMVDGHTHNTIAEADRALYANIRRFTKELAGYQASLSAVGAKEVVLAELEQRKSAIKPYLTAEEFEKQCLKFESVENIDQAVQARMEFAATMVARVEQRISQLKEDVESMDRQWELVRHFNSLGAANDWKKVISEALANGDCVSIVSYSNYPNMISRFLQEKIGLDVDQLKQIPVISYLPSQNEQDFYGKNSHIKKAMAEFGVKNDLEELKKEMIFLDDDLNNCDLAKVLCGHIINAVPGSTNHLDELAGCLGIQLAAENKLSL